MYSPTTPAIFRPRRKIRRTGCSQACAMRDSIRCSPRNGPIRTAAPAYTRKGYELIQRLKLNDVEARFATAINGSESLQNIAKKISVPLNDALLIVFRFQALDIIDYWSSSVLSLPASQTNPAGGDARQN